MEFKDKLKTYRKELEEIRGEKVGQVKLASELGISRGNIGDLETGVRQPSKKIISILVKHSGKSIDYWMNGTKEYEAPDTVAILLDKLIELKVITSTELDSRVWKLITKSILIEIERKLNSRSIDKHE